MTRRGRAMGILVPAILLASAGTTGQQIPTFRGGTDSVEVDVVVTDSNNRPVSDLRQEEFEIVDRGRTQRITSFERVSVPLPPRRSSASRPVLPSVDVASNARATQNPRGLVIVIDDLHLIETDIVATKLVLSRFIDALASDDHVAVVFTGRSDLGQDFTTDKGRLAQALDRVREAFGFGLDANAPGRSALHYARSATQTMTNVVQSLAEGGFTRRAVLYVSGQSVIDPHASMSSPGYQVGLTYQIALDALFDAARRANVPIYTIDPRGMVTPETAVRGRGATAAEERVGIAERLRVQQANLETIAASTGGRAFINRSNLGGAVDEMVQENGSYYLLTFSPDPIVRDGKFRPIDVRVTRRGLRVRARPGYVVAAAAPVTSTERKLAMALGAARGGGGLGIRATAAPVARTADRMTVAVSVDVTYPPASDPGRQLEDTLLVGLVALDGDGRSLASSRRQQSFRATSKGSEPIGLLVYDAIDVPARRRLLLRIGVASTSRGEAGSVTVPVELAASASGDVEVGGVVLGLTQARATPALGAALLAGFVPFQPTTMRTFTPSDTLRVSIPVFWRSRDTAAELMVWIESGTSGPIQRRLFPLTRDDRRRGATLDAALDLAGLPTGAYVLVAAARLANGSQAVRQVAFEVR